MSHTRTIVQLQALSPVQWSLATAGCCQIWVPPHHRKPTQSIDSPPLLLHTTSGSDGTHVITKTQDDPNSQNQPPSSENRFYLAGDVPWVSEWKLLSHVRLFATPWTIQIHGILWARILEWVAFSFSRGSSQPREGSLPTEPQGKPKGERGEWKRWLKTQHSKN